MINHLGFTPVLLLLLLLPLPQEVEVVAAVLLGSPFGCEGATHTPEDKPCNAGMTALRMLLCKATKQGQALHTIYR